MRQNVFRFLADLRFAITILLIIASFSFLLFLTLTKISLISILIVNLPIIMHLNKISKSEKYEDFDPELKKVALSTFALSILFWLTLVFLS